MGVLASQLLVTFLLGSRLLCGSEGEATAPRGPDDSTSTSSSPGSTQGSGSTQGPGDSSQDCSRDGVSLTSVLVVPLVGVV